MTKEERAVYTKAYYEKNRDKISVQAKIRNKRRYVIKKDSQRERFIKRTYGISTNEYNQRVADQNGLCAICKQPDQKHPNLAIDHDHKTGKIRSLLCRKCNLILGHVEKNVEHIRLMLQYIENYKD